MSTPKAHVYRHRLSPFWSARFHAWDAKRQQWVLTTKSTKSAEKGDAQLIANEYAAIAAKAGPGKRVSRETFVDTLNQILRLAGHRPVVVTTPWSVYSAAWLATQEKRNKRLDPKTGRKSLADGTFATYKGQLKNFNEWLGTDTSLPIDAFDGPQLQEWYDEQIESGLAATTANNMATMLATIFQRAQDEGITTRNPVNLIDRDPHEGNTRDPFTQADQDAILAYLRSGDDSWRTREITSYATAAKRTPPSTADWLTTALLGLCTSQRLGDCVNAVITQFEESKPFLIWTPTQRKGGKAMRIPIVKPAAAHIRALLKQRRQEGGDSLFLTPTLAGLPSGKFYGLSRQFMLILAACGVAGRHVQSTGERGRGFHSKSFHSTRHTCNTALADADIPADIRKQITGHSDDRTNATYTHLADATKAKALTKAFKKPKAAAKKKKPKAA